MANELHPILTRVDPKTAERIAARSLENRRSMGSEVAIILRDFFANQPEERDLVAEHYGRGAEFKKD